MNTTLLNVKRYPDFTEKPIIYDLEQELIIQGIGPVKIRPIRLEDEAEMIHFHKRLSSESVYLRYFEYLKLDIRTGHERLVRICTNSEESFALVIETVSSDEPPSIIAVGRLTKTYDPFKVTFDTIMIDENISRVAHILILRLIKLATGFGFKSLTSDLLIADHKAIEVCLQVGFTRETLPADGVVRLEYAL